MEEIAYISSLASLVIGVGAAILAIFFFKQAQEADKKAAVSLARIDAQTGMLERITGQHMGTLIDRATSPHPDLHRLIDVIVNPPAGSVIAERSSAPTSAEHEKATNARLYVWGALYACMANAFGANKLKQLGVTSEDYSKFLDDYNNYVQEIVNYMDSEYSAYLSPGMQSRWDKIKTELFPGMRTRAQFKP